jgi:hypothetical protein
MDLGGGPPHDTKDYEGRRQTGKIPGTAYALTGLMETLNRSLILYRPAIRMAWIAIAVLLAACNNGGDGGGFPGY